MTGRVVRRVLCREDGSNMAVVRLSPEGAVYETTRPVLPASPPLVDGGGAMTRSLKGKTGRRLREVMEQTSVLLTGPEAERYTASPERWGSLPAWCRRCRAERWIELDVLRRGGPDIVL